MIDRPALISWRSKAPWPSNVQVEQDLLLSRLMIEIARDDVLGPELAMRGGTCMHKLHLPAALRYSEDLDYVRSTHTGIKPYTQALARIADGVGLTVSSRRRSGQMVHVHLDGEPTEGIGRVQGSRGPPLENTGVHGVVLADEYVNDRARIEVANRLGWARSQIDVEPGLRR